MAISEQIFITPVLSKRWLTACAAVLVAGVAAAAPADTQAPVPGRFQVFRGEAGYQLRGYRAEIGSEDRFVLTAGMPAAAARRQMLSIGWDQAYGLADLDARELWGRRVLYGHIVETVAVILDPAGEYAKTVAYSRQPARYSRFGLEYFLRAAFREGRVLASSEEQVLMEYGPLGGAILRVEATQLPGTETQWRLVFRMDAL